MNGAEGRGNEMLMPMSRDLRLLRDERDQVLVTSRRRRRQHHHEGKTKGRTDASVRSKTRRNHARNSRYITHATSASRENSRGGFDRLSSFLPH